MDQFSYAANAVDIEVVMNTPWPMLGYVQQLTEEIEALKARIELLESKLNRNSSNSNQPPSNDSPFKPKSDPRQDKKKSARKRKGARQQCLRPSEVRELFPERCACGCKTLHDPEPYYLSLIHI